jgi:hypothetical protein
MVPCRALLNSHASREHAGRLVSKFRSSNSCNGRPTSSNQSWPASVGQRSDRLTQAHRANRHFHRRRDSVSIQQKTTHQQSKMNRFQKNFGRKLSEYQSRSKPAFPHVFLDSTVGRKGNLLDPRLLIAYRQRILRASCVNNTFGLASATRFEVAIF